ncbi:MAG: FtsW/RodA/SpoVE family cell cycle protein, partial [Alistipes sp.]|nr:FtsW/RodA/SpoVE family cell cycle protein [Alistipes sp.]
MIDRGGRNSNEVVLFSGVDWWTVLLYVALTIIGFVAVFSASYVEDTDNFFSFSHEYIKHIFWLGLSYTAGLVILLLDRSSWHKFAYYICAVTIFIVLLTFVPGLGKTVNGARAWLGFGGFTLQPMELAKVGISLAVARLMSVYGFSVNRGNDLVKVMAILAIPMGIA